MKKCMWLIIVVLSLLLVACKPSVYEVYVDSVPYTIDSENQTITHGEENYTYRIDGDLSDYEITIIFPDGSRYVESKHYTMDNSDFSEEERRVAYSLAQWLENEVPIRKKTFRELVGPVMLGVVLIGIGIFRAKRPDLMWKINHHASVKGGEPTEWYLNFEQISGWVNIVIGIAVIFISVVV